MKRLSAVLVAVLLLVTVPVHAQLPAGLHMQGVTMANAAGDRFVISGVNMEMYRDYANGCGWVTDGTYAIRAAMADRVKAMGINMVRLNYSARFLAQGDNLTKFLDMATELAMRGVYVMPADHTYTGGALVNSSGGFATKLAIIEGMRARGLESYLVEGGYNEPGPNVTVAAWSAAYKNLLTYLRTTAQFKGVVVVDGTGWSTLLDVNAFKALQAIDAGLLGGQANIVFSNHLYPNIQDLPAQIWQTANQVPLLIGEIGPENPGASPFDLQYVRNVISGFMNAGYAAGHNGIMFWILGFCDSNKMMEDWENPSVPYTATSKLSSFGQLAVDAYYSKLPGAVIPPPQPTIIAQQPTSTPTRSVVPTNTPRPRSPTPTRTATDVPVIIVSNTPAPTVIGCAATITRDIVFNGRPARENVCITYN